MSMSNVLVLSMIALALIECCVGSSFGSTPGGGIDVGQFGDWSKLLDRAPRLRKRASRMDRLFEAPVSFLQDVESEPSEDIEYASLEEELIPEINSGLLPPQCVVKQDKDMTVVINLPESISCVSGRDEEQDTEIHAYPQHGKVRFYSRLAVSSLFRGISETGSCVDEVQKLVCKSPEVSLGEARDSVESELARVGEEHELGIEDVDMLSDLEEHDVDYLGELDAEDPVEELIAEEEEEDEEEEEEVEDVEYEAVEEKESGTSIDAVPTMSVPSSASSSTTEDDEGDSGTILYLDPVLLFALLCLGVVFT